jgi:RNA polymerase sigma-70 factor, ECF subfamily
LSAVNEGKLDPAIVAQLYERYGEDLRRFLVGLLRDIHLASDVLQTTFAKLAELGHTTREASRRGWLFRVAYHEAMLLRRRAAMGETHLRRVAWSRDAVAEPVDQSVVRQETVDRMRQAIDELPPAQRQVVRMRIYEEKTFAVIAEKLQIPLGTALGRMHAATEKLRARLAE